MHEKQGEIFQICPFCKVQLHADMRPSEFCIIYDCVGNPDHTFLQSIIINTDEDITTHNLYRIKLRLGVGDIRYYMKIDYMRKVSEIWIGRNNTPGRISIPYIIQVDMLDPKSIIRKIKAYTMLS